MAEVKILEVVSMPMLAMRGINVFPEMLLSFDVERKASVAALNSAGKKDRLIFLVGQKNPAVDLPEAKDLYTTGVVARIRQQLQQPGGNLCRVLVEGLYRARAVSVSYTESGFVADIEKLENAQEKVSDARREALMRNCISLYEEFLQLNGSYSPEHLLGLYSKNNASYVADFVAQNVPFPIEDKQKLLEELRPCKRLDLIVKIVNHELDVLTIEKELNDATQEAMSKSQKEYFLREEMKIIQAELGEDDGGNDIDDYRQKVEALSVSDEIKAKLKKEISHLAKQPFGSSEGALIRSYLDTCLEIPWGKLTKETVDIGKARKMLDKDHYGLEKVKERILEFLAVRQLAPEIKGGLICLVGPPGTGKTSIAMSIAKATGRKLVRVSLGGVHDEAEIRGHRKTYVGAMPGRIINGIIQAGSANPLMVLDEIDKLGSDYRGDPSAALLEAFDPEQNSTFRDHFLEIPFDLSNVFFITTANTTSTIPPALLDRMEVIELSSYTDEEKVQIVKKHILPKQRKKHGLSGTQLKVSDDAVRKVISLYTRESGVRKLENEIARICRKAASGIAEEKFNSLSVGPDSIHDLLGPEKVKGEEKRNRDEIGLVRGLAYTTAGGEVLDVEVAVVDGTGKIDLTGNLGDVMKESARAAMTCIRARASILGIDPEFYKKKDIHIHFPEAAVPKDGPSAGITMSIALISALTDMPVRHDIAMTGEISLRGRVMAIGGLREKTMAALRNGVKTVLIPKDNVSDLEEIDPLVRAQLNFVPVATIDEAIASAFTQKPGETKQDFVLPPLTATGESTAIKQ